MSSGIRHKIKVGEMPSILDCIIDCRGIWSQLVNAFHTERHSNSTSDKTLCQPSSKQAGDLNSWWFAICSPLKSSTSWTWWSLHTIYYGIHFHMLVNDRHLLRYLEKYTCFEPKKVWNEEIIHREEREFKAEWDRRWYAEREGWASEGLWFACILQLGVDQVRPFLLAQV